MKTAGIIAEYNPFHNGHQYHIEQTRRVTGADAVVCVMSGCFVQRGDCAIADKWTRAHAALLGGADLVLELPVYYSLAVAQLFAYGAVAALDALGCVDFLSFGMETDNLSQLDALAKKLVSESGKIEAETKKYLDGYTGYPAARQKALTALYGVEKALINTPNNMLALEYLCQLRLQGSMMQPVGIKRCGAAYHDAQITSQFASATAIRTALKQNSDFRAAVPETAYALYQQARQNGVFPVFASQFDQMLLSFLRRSRPEELQNIIDMPHGMENRLIRAANRAGTVEELVELCSVKHYTRARIRRLLFASLIGIPNMGYAKPPSYLRVLGMNRTGREVLSQIRDACRLPIIVKAANFPAKDTDPLFLLDCKSTDLYCLAYQNTTLRRGGPDYTRTPIILK